MSALAGVGAPVVVALALLLQGEPPRDVVQLGRVGQVNEDLGTGKRSNRHLHKKTKERCRDSIDQVILSKRFTSPRKSLEEHLS